MTTTKEQQKFGERLCEALIRHGESISSPTTLMRKLNQIFDGPHITVHVVRKWLLGEAIPTQEKLVILARWLNVSAEWLRYDSHHSAVVTGSPESVPLQTPEVAHLVAIAKALDEQDRLLLEQVAKRLKAKR